MNLTLLPSTCAICRLAADAPLPDWAQGEFASITRTTDELSIVCRQDQVPDAVRAEIGWRCFQVEGKLDFSKVGVIGSLTSVLAEEGISVFVVSTYDTDFVLVRESNLSRAVQALERAGYRVGGHE